MNEENVQACLVGCARSLLCAQNAAQISLWPPGACRQQANEAINTQVTSERYDIKAPSDTVVWGSLLEEVTFKRNPVC